MLRVCERPDERCNTNVEIETNKGLGTSILREQIRLAMEQLPSGRGASLIVALILCYAVRDIVPYINIFGWVTLVLLTVLSEILFYHKFSKVREDSFTEGPWKNAYLILVLIAGVIWGLSALIIFPAGNPELISLFVLVMGSIAATTTISHSAIRFAPVVWVGPVVLFYVIRSAMEGGEFGYTICLLCLLYLLTVVSYSSKHNKSITSAIALEFKNLELLEEVRRVNDSLCQEIAERKRAEEERRRLEDRLQRAEKMEALGTLAGGVAHDLNNVLGVVVGYSDLLVNDSGESSPAGSKAMQILKGGLRATAIVQDLLTLARRGVSNRKVLNLNNIVLECQSLPEFAGISSCHPNIRLKTDLEAHLLNISGSSVHLGKSLMNLVANAAEAMPDGGVITIKTGNQYLDLPVCGYDEVREGDYVVLSVSDTGEGIPARDLKRIFEPFYTKKVMGRSGTGLGLAVIWGTVKDHLGYINVESQEGKGSVFTIYFPVTREEISRDQVSIAAAEYMGNGESILIVDDVKEQRELAGAMLKKLNYSAVSVRSGEEAVEYLKQNAVTLVVLDMIMDPGMDGLDTYAKILETHPRQRAIIVSGFSETERVSRAQALGAGTYVRKPYILEKLGLAVRKELDQPA